MSRLLPLLFIVLLSSITASFAQLSGVKTIPGDYASIANAVAAVNALGVGSGGVTFNIAGGYTETAINITLTTTTSSQANPIVFQKWGTGDNPLITADVGIGLADGIFKIVGTDYVTIDGISVQESNANTTNTQKAEWGFALLKASTTNGAQHNVIKNCTVQLSPAYINNRGIYQSSQTATGASVAYSNNPLGSNSYNTFHSNFITSCYVGINLIGSNDANFSAGGYPGSDRNNNIGDTLLGNVITGFGGVSNATAKGIGIDFQRDFMVANNVVDNSATAHPGGVSGIDMDASNNSSAIVNNNSVVVATNILSSSSCYGIKYICGTATASFNSSLVFSNNLVQNFTGPTAATSLSFRAMQITSEAMMTQIFNNTAINNHISAATTAGGSITGIYATVNYGAAQVHHNAVVDNGYLSLIYGNADGIVVAMGSSSAFDFQVHHNVVTELKAGKVEGITHSGGNNGDVYNNKIAELHGVGSQANLIGLSVSGGIGTVQVFNNLSGMFATPTSSHISAQWGIRISPSVNSYYKLWHNTVLLQGSSTANGIMTAALVFNGVGQGLDIRNNIFVNDFTSTGNGRAMAIQSSASPAALANSVLNYNLLYAGTPSVNSYIFYYNAGGNNNFQSFASYQTTGLDAQSVSGAISFASYSGASLNFLKPDELAPNIAEGKGIAIAAVPVDYDSVNRSTSPDLGAYEISGIPLAATLLYFKGHRQNTDNILAWALGQLNKDDVMLVQRSKDGKAFESIAKIITFEEEGTYGYEDRAIEGDNYYRIAVLSVDGSSSYSKVIRLNGSTYSLHKPVLYPNPASNFVSIANVEGPLEVSIYNYAGQSVSKQNIVERQAVDITHLKPAKYLIVFSYLGVKHHLSFIKFD